MIFSKIWDLRKWLGIKGLRRGFRLKCKKGCNIANLCKTQKHMDVAAKRHIRRRKAMAGQERRKG
jgi:hypothetical protein